MNPLILIVAITFFSLVLFVARLISLARHSKNPKYRIVRKHKPEEIEVFKFWYTVEIHEGFGFYSYEYGSYELSEAEKYIKTRAIKIADEVVA